MSTVIQCYHAVISKYAMVIVTKLYNFMFQIKNSTQQQLFGLQDYYNILASSDVCWLAESHDAAQTRQRLSASFGQTACLSLWQLKHGLTVHRNWWRGAHFSWGVSGMWRGRPVRHHTRRGHVGSGQRKRQIWQGKHYWFKINCATMSLSLISMWYRDQICFWSLVAWTRFYEYYNNTFKNHTLCLYNNVRSIRFHTQTENFLFTMFCMFTMTCMLKPPHTRTLWKRSADISRKYQQQQNTFDNKTFRQAFHAAKHCQNHVGAAYRFMPVLK